MLLQSDIMLVKHIKLSIVFPLALMLAHSHKVQLALLLALTQVKLVRELMPFLLVIKPDNTHNLQMVLVVRLLVQVLPLVLKPVQLIKRNYVSQLVIKPVQFLKVVLVL